MADEEEVGYGSLDNIIFHHPLLPSGANKHSLDRMLINSLLLTSPRTAALMMPTRIPSTLATTTRRSRWHHSAHQTPDHPQPFEAIQYLDSQKKSRFDELQFAQSVPVCDIVMFVAVFNEVHIIWLNNQVQDRKCSGAGSGANKRTLGRPKVN